MVRIWLQEEVKISEVSESSILSYTQDQKLRNLGKFSLQIFAVVVTYDAKTTKN